MLGQIGLSGSFVSAISAFKNSFFIICSLGSGGQGTGNQGNGQTGKQANGQTGKQGTGKQANREQADGQAGKQGTGRRAGQLLKILKYNSNS